MQAALKGSPHESEIRTLRNSLHEKTDWWEHQQKAAQNLDTVLVSFFSVFQLSFPLLQ
jgi:hypothetical protein